MLHADEYENDHDYPGEDFSTYNVESFFQGIADYAAESDPEELHRELAEFAAKHDPDHAGTAFRILVNGDLNAALDNFDDYYDPADWVSEWISDDDAALFHVKNYPGDLEEIWSNDIRWNIWCSDRGIDGYPSIETYDDLAWILTGTNTIRKYIENCS